jgi:hypothetical protein
MNGYPEVTIRSRTLELPRLRLTLDVRMLLALLTLALSVSPSPACTMIRSRRCTYKPELPDVTVNGNLMNAGAASDEVNAMVVDGEDSDNF